MKFNLQELKIIERLLSNRINVDYDPDIENLLYKVRNEINNANKDLNGVCK